MSLDQRIGFIGGGNMAEALIRGLLSGAGVPPDHIGAADPNGDRAAELANLYGIRTTADNLELLDRSDVVVLAVKPQVMPAVLDQIGDHVRNEQLVISIAAGVTITVMEAALPAKTRVVRTMPNTPALVQTGATAIAAGSCATQDDVSTAKQIFEAVGITAVVQERDLDAVTGLSGSGPAYFFLVVEALIDAGVGVGLDPHTARAFATQTALGAARLMVETGEPPAQLRRKVSSPGGTTLAGLAVLDDADLRGAFAAAVKAAAARSAELGRSESDDT